MEGNIKLQNASMLIKDKKYAKALAVLKKLNKKKNLRSSVTYSLEGACYTNSDNFVMADIAYKNSLSLAQSEGERLSAIKNLKAIALRQQDYTTAINYLKQELAIDGSAQNALSRMQLCQLSFQIGDIETVEENLPKLLTLSDYAISAMFLYVQMFITRNRPEAAKYLNRLASELNNLSEDNVMMLLTSYIELGEVTKAKHIYELIKAEYGRETWCLQVENKLLSVDLSESVTEKESKTSTRDIVVGTNQPVIAIVQRLVDDLLASGAVFHNDLILEENSNNLSAKIVKEHQAFQEYMSVPITCMPLTGDYDYEVDSQFNLIATLKNDAVNPRAQNIMKDMVALYNETKKLESWVEASPLLLLFDAPKLAEVLINGKVFSNKIKRFKKLFEERNFNELLIQSFLGSREFTYTNKMLEKAGLKTDKSSERGLLATIDFLNHKTGSTGYTYDSNSSSISVTGKADKYSQELFVQYNISDPLATYLIYGFIDIKVSWIFSVSTELFTRGGASILVLNDPVKISRKLNANVKHLRTFMPGVIQSNGKNIVLSSLVIPDRKHHNTLKEVLAFVLLENDFCRKYSSRDVLKAEVKYLEQQLIEKNLEYWRKLSQEIGNTETKVDVIPEQAFQDISKLCDFYIRHINNYVSF